MAPPPRDIGSFGKHAQMLAAISICLLVVATGCSRSSSTGIGTYLYATHGGETVSIPDLGVTNDGSSAFIAVGRGKHLVGFNKSGKIVTHDVTWGPSGSGGLAIAGAEVLLATSADELWRLQTDGTALKSEKIVINEYVRGQFEGVESSADGHTVATGGSSGGLRMRRDGKWTTADLSDLDGAWISSALAISPNGEWIIAATAVASFSGDKPNLVIWHTTDGTTRLIKGLGAPIAVTKERLVAYDASAKMLVELTVKDGQERIRSPVSPRPLVVCGAHGDWFYIPLEWGNWPKRLSVRRLSTQEEVAGFDTPKGAKGAAFSSDCSQLVYAEHRVDRKKLTGLNLSVASLKLTR